MTDVHTPERRSYNMSRIKGRDTRPEKTLRSLLHRNGLRFRVHDKRLPGHPDIVLPRYRSIIFVHGCFWHRHPGCRYATVPETRSAFWKEKFSRNMERDRRNILLLEEAGWNPIVVWECELKKDSTSVLEKTLVLLQDHARRISGKSPTSSAENWHHGLNEQSK